ncbi:MAG TPA: hypothetical protein HPP76_11525 [Desulfuromonadales bacterium]|nr:hypothetical protein [Desulfuromonadales bacterium]
MAVVEQVPNELEKLLADVQRTIRENALFISSLKKEAADSAAAESDEEADDSSGADSDEYEEL